MILIGGLEIDVSILPLADSMDYMVETDRGKLGIKLKTVAKSNSCLAVYLQKELDEIDLVEEVENKVVYFEDEAELISKLSFGTETANVSSIEEESKEVELTKSNEGVENFQPVDEKIELKTPEPVSVDVSETLEEVNDDFMEDFFTLPDMPNTDDAHKKQIELKEAMIKQREGTIADLQNTIDNLYQVQETQLLELQSDFDSKVNEANATIESLNKQLVDSHIPEEDLPILKFAPYLRSPKAVLKEGFTEEELDEMGDFTSRITILSSGAGDSLHTMLSQVKGLMDRGTETLVVDFTNDYYLPIKIKPPTKLTSLDLANRDVEHVVSKNDNYEYIQTALYNDIALLGLNWIEVIKKLLIYADGRQIMFLFGNINNFSVRHTVSRLSTIGSLFVMVNCHPANLVTLSGDLAYIPSERFNVVGINYREPVKEILTSMKKKYRVSAFTEEIDWVKLGVK